MKNLKQIFSSFIKKHGRKRLAITTHREADLDAIASCYAISFILKNSDIVLIDNPDDQVNLLIEKLGIKYKFLKEVSAADYAGLVIVDSSSSVLLKGFESESWKKLCIIDHHRVIGKDVSAEFEIIDEDSPSASEIIANLLPKIDQKTAFALSVGIIADTSQFSSGRIKTFETLAKIMRKSNSSYKELLFYAEPPKSLDKKIAIAKAIQTTKFVEHKGYVIAICKTGSSESDVATMLASKLDVAFVAKRDSKDRSFTRISGRVNKNTDIKLNEVMMKVGEMLNGKGGGHYKAAGARVQAKPDEALNLCIEILKQKLDGKSS